MREIDIMQLANEMLASQICLIDVREVSEYQTGHVPGAKLIAMSVIPARVQELSRDETLYIICESGGRSFQVAEWLDQQGFETVNILGGTSAWRESGKPLEL